MRLRARTWQRVGIGRSAAGILSVALALGTPGTGLLLAAPSAPADLTVASDPAGASVRVDGRLRGTTPLVMDDVPPGAHRVTLSLDGYLENSRVVTVGPGGGESLDIRLTAGATRDGGSKLAEGAEDPSQPEPMADKQGSDNKLKIALIGAGAAGLLVGGYLLFSGGGAPSVSGVTANPSGVVGIPSVTEFTFTAQASDPDGDALSYEWSFGDGATSTEQVGRHVYDREGTFTATVTVTNQDGESAGGSAQVTVRSLSGTWLGNLDTQFDTVVNLSQTGTELGGTYSDNGGSQGTITGRVQAPRNVTFTVNLPPYLPYTFSGYLSDQADRLDGRVNGSGYVEAMWSMTR